MKNNYQVDGPAIEWSYGSKKWYQKGKNHRLGGPATLTWSNENEEWHIDDIGYSEEEYKIEIERRREILRDICYEKE